MILSWLIHYLVCPYCGDIKEVTWIFQDFTRDKNKGYQPCHCDIGALSPPRLNNQELTYIPIK